MSIKKIVMPATHWSRDTYRRGQWSGNSAGDLACSLFHKRRSQMWVCGGYYEGWQRTVSTPMLT